MIQKPARYSFDSTKGPSVNTALATPVVDDGGRARRPEAGGEDPVALGLEPLVEHVDGRRLGRGGQAGRVVDHGNQVLHLGSSPVVIAVRFSRRSCGRPLGRYTWIVTPFESVRESTRSSAMSGPASGKSRAPWPRITGTMSRVHLVDEVVLEQPSDQGRAAVHLQLTRPLGLQLADGGREVAGEDGRVRPARFGERGRCEVLGPRVQGSGDLVVGRILRRGASSLLRAPEAGEELVRPPAEQERVGALRRSR